MIEPFVEGIDLCKEVFPHMAIREGRIFGVPMRLFRISFTGDMGLDRAVGKEKADFVGKRSLFRSAMMLPARKQLVGLITVDADIVLEEGAQIIKEKSSIIPAKTIGIEISGPLATLALNAGCPLDLENMAVSSCTRMILDKAQLILMKTDKQEYRLEILRSFAPYVWSFLKRVGRDLQGP